MSSSLRAIMASYRATSFLPAFLVALLNNCPKQGSGVHQWLFRCACHLLVHLEQSAIVELLKVLLKARAEDSGVASKLIATVADLERIASDDHADTPALHGWRREAFGEDALRLKRGELALVLDGVRVRVVEVRRAPRTAAD